MKEMQQAVQKMEQACWDTLGALHKMGYRDIKQLRERFEVEIQHLAAEPPEPLGPILVGFPGGQV